MSDVWALADFSSGPQQDWGRQRRWCLGRPLQSGTGAVRDDGPGRLSSLLEGEGRTTTQPATLA